MKLDEWRDFGLTENQKHRRTIGRDFAERGITPRVEACEREGRYPRDMLQGMSYGARPRHFRESPSARPPLTPGAPFL